MANSDVSLVPGTAPAPSHEMAIAGRNAIALSASLIISWSVAFFIRFPVPRILGPARFGDLNFAENFAATFLAFIELGVGTYIYKEIPVRPQHASDFWGGVNVVRALVSLLVFAGMAITLAVTGHGVEMQLTVLVFGLAMATATTSASLSGMLTAVGKVNNIATSGVFSKLLWGAGLVVALVWFPWLPLLALPLLLAELARVAVLGWDARRMLKLKFHVDRPATRAVLKASLPYFTANGAIIVGGRLGVTVLEFVAPDVSEVGWFGASQNIASLTLLLAPLLTWILMPILARAKERSEAELYAIFRRSLEGLLVLTIPMTLVVSLGARFWLVLAFKEPYAPASLSLSFLGYGFVFIYLAMMLANLLVLVGRGWTVSLISMFAIPVRPVLILVLAVPCARYFGPGGAALGAALAELVAGIGTVVAQLLAVGSKVVDRRLLVATLKSLAIVVLVGFLDHWAWRKLPDIERLALDLGLYAGLTLALGVVRRSEAVRLVRALRQAGLKRSRHQWPRE